MNLSKPRASVIDRPDHIKLSRLFCQLFCVLIVIISPSYLKAAFKVKFGLSDACLSLRDAAGTHGNKIHCIPEGTIFDTTDLNLPKGDWTEITAYDPKGNILLLHGNLNKKYVIEIDSSSTKLYPNRTSIDQRITVFKNPGQQLHCSNDACPRIGWPDGGQPLTRLATKFVQINDTSGGDDNYVWAQYYKVKYKAIGGGVLTGWVDATDVTPDPVYERISPKICDPTKIQATGDDINKKLRNNSESGIDDIYEQIKNHVGFCTLKPGKKGKPKLYPKTKLGVSPWSAFVLPNWTKKKNWPQININEAGMPKKLTQSHLIDIDSCARTTFGEMHGCKIHFAKAVIAITNNRVLAQRVSSGARTRFKRKNLPADQARWSLPFTNTVTTMRVGKDGKKFNGGQYNTWDPFNYSKKFNHNPPLRTSLCPPRSVLENSANGRRPTRKVVKHWRQVVKTCIRAVTNPIGFRKETRGKHGLNSYYYTSTVDWKDALGCNKKALTAKKKASCAKVTELGRYKRRSIDGETLNEAKCMRIWHDDSMPSMNIYDKRIKALK